MIAHAGGTTTTEFMSGLEALWKCKDVTFGQPRRDRPGSLMAKSRRFSDAAAVLCEL
jgi:hypothetical protein